MSSGRLAPGYSAPVYVYGLGGLGVREFQRFLDVLVEALPSTRWTGGEGLAAWNPVDRGYHTEYMKLAVYHGSVATWSRSVTGLSTRELQNLQGVVIHYNEFMLSTGYNDE